MKTKEDFIQLIRTLISDNKIEEALNFVEKYAQKNMELLNSLTLFRSRVKHNSDFYFNLAIIRKDEYMLEVNKINWGILHAIRSSISEKTRFDEKDWSELFGQTESIKKDFLNPQLHIVDDLYKKKIVTIIEYILKRSVDRTFDALELCTDTIEGINSTLPHAYEYRALCNFLVSPIETMIEKNAVEVIEDLDFAKKVGKSDNHDKIAQFIGLRLQSTLTSLISRLKRELAVASQESKDIKRREILNYILAYNSVCYRIHPSINFKKAIVEELSGHNELAWLDFADYSLCSGWHELKNNVSSIQISINDYVLDEVSIIKTSEPTYKQPKIKIGSTDSEPKYVSERLKWMCFVYGFLLIISFFTGSFYFFDDIAISFVSTLLFVFGAYFLRNIIPCLWYFIYAIVDFFY